LIGVTTVSADTALPQMSDKTTNYITQSTALTMLGGGSGVWEKGSLAIQSKKTADKTYGLGYAEFKWPGAVKSSDDYVISFSTRINTSVSLLSTVSSTAVRFLGSADGKNYTLNICRGIVELYENGQVHSRWLRKSTGYGLSDESDKVLVGRWGQMSIRLQPSSSGKVKVSFYINGEQLRNRDNDAASVELNALKPALGFGLINHNGCIQNISVYKTADAIVPTTKLPVNTTGKSTGTDGTATNPGRTDDPAQTGTTDGIIPGSTEASVPSSTLPAGKDATGGLSAGSLVAIIIAVPAVIGVVAFIIYNEKTAKKTLSLILVAVLSIWAFLPARIESKAMRYSEISVSYLGLTNEVVSKSVLAEGNTARLASVMKKAKAGGTITLGFIGGSITYGSGVAESGGTPDERFPNIVRDWWKDTFPNATINLLNAGIPSTGSYLGVYRMQDDLLAHNPDVIVLEFAVNDGDSFANRQSYEGMIRRSLKQPNNPAVISLFMCKNDFWCSQDMQAGIAKHYNLPMITYRDAIRLAINNGLKKMSDFTTDGVHPNTYGNAVVGLFLTSYFQSIFDKLDTLSTKVDTALPDSILPDIMPRQRSATAITPCRRLWAAFRQYQTPATFKGSNTAGVAQTAAQNPLCLKTRPSASPLSIRRGPRTLAMRWCVSTACQWRFWRGKAALADILISLTG
jgi:lysophospholipase L1-like esterase